jgi:elongation factor Ts
MVITADKVKELRDMTGVSVMQCKKALEEAGGDMEKAVLILKKKSSEIAAKKAERELKDGLVVIKSSGDKAVLVALLCETDFVAKNADFIDLTNKLADKALSEGVEAANKIAGEEINLLIQKIGENMQLGKIEIVPGKDLGIYIHNGKVGTIVSLEGGSGELARDVAMHIAAMKPEYKSVADVPENTKNSVREIFMKEVEGSDKPAEIKEKMLQGKIDAYFKEKALMSQSFIKNPDLTIEKLLQNGNAKLSSYVFYSVS